MNKKNIFLLVIILPVVLVVCAGFYTVSKFYSSYDGPDVRFTIHSGEGFSSVNYRLKKEKIINDARMFHYYTKYTDQLGALKAGTYKIKSGINMVDVLETFTKGVPELTRITIPEGKNLYEIGKILEANGIVSANEFIGMCKNQDVIESLNIKAPSIEGYLFPETYMFSPSTPAKQVIETMLRQFKEKTSKLNLDSTELSAHEVVILASIVEKETGAKWERPTIAGVYLNRLKKRMRLQADPTTIYGIWESYNGNLKRKHLLQKTPYNTYKMSGLPLGPIANPSLAAIKAVLEPKEHNYIFFVSKNDGTHVFTPTYKEHQKAVDYWQKNHSRRKGKSWRDLKQ
jgi:UPF0755 protein